jgi:hypothetical protein
VVRQIFVWRVDDELKLATIAERLNTDLRQYPSPMPPGRWTTDSVRRIVGNIKYTGLQAWARTVAGRPAPPEQWITSRPNAHEPLIDERTFRQAQPRAREDRKCA